MPVLLSFAPIDATPIAYEFTGDIPESLIEEYGLSDDTKYEHLPQVWDVDAQHYVIVKNTLEECIDTGIERFRQELHGRYEDGLEWDDEVKAMTWEEYWNSFANCLSVTDHLTITKL